MEIHWNSRQASAILPALQNAVWQLTNIKVVFIITGPEVDTNNINVSVISAI
jgi:hypothetical protein